MAQPRFSNTSLIVKLAGKVIVADSAGALWVVDAERGTARPVRIIDGVEGPTSGPLNIEGSS
jgi:hypothetical protein